MNEVELDQRGTMPQPVGYDMLSQQDYNSHSSPIDDNQLTTPHTRDNAPRTKSTSSISKPLLPIVKVESLQSTSKLPPKPFTQGSVIRRIWKHTSTAIATIIMILIPVVIAVLSSNRYISDSARGDTYCTSTGIYGASVSALSGPSTSFSSTFSIDTVFGSFSFGMAKFIDLIWDIGFSRCGQAFLGWVTFRVNSAALLRIMETKHVSYDLFSSLSLSWSSIATLGPVMRAFFERLGWRKKLLLFWILLNVTWVVFWPTFTNAMTGYIAKNDTLVKLENGIGYATYSDIANLTNLAFQFTGLNFSSPMTSPSNITLVFTGPWLFSTGPNITLWNELYQLWLPTKTTGYEIVYNSTAMDLYQTSPLAVYWYQSDAYQESYFADGGNVQCVATGVYQWGFSHSITSFFVLFNTIWCAGTYALWIYVNWRSELCRKGRTLGQYRAAIDLVESMHQDLGKDICAYSEQELKDELKKKGGIKYYVEEGDGDATSHIGITSRKESGPVHLKFGELYGCSRKRR
ncbi:uncharacterized protein PAC_00024 [Phialocephala subalpina]|uniref:Uncharacterized protein n=1 Tax=Phialocephala subalpina TaxID=576137 RepID=A0A1L7WBK0_9HELO|nr:uncharacterized protein PAC_00024 [Phialocephala subalpina]